MHKVLGILVVSSVVLQTSTPPPATPSHSHRMAAITFALGNGLKVPAENLVVLTDEYLGAVDGHPAPTRDVQRDTLEIARSIGPVVKTGHSNTYLRCPSRGFCVAKTPTAVLEIAGMYRDETDVGIRLYAPGPDSNNPSLGSTVTTAIVDLEKRGDLWVGVRFSKAPASRTSTK